MPLDKFSSYITDLFRRDILIMLVLSGWRSTFGRKKLVTSAIYGERRLLTIWAIQQIHHQVNIADNTKFFKRHFYNWRYWFAATLPKELLLFRDSGIRNVSQWKFTGRFTASRGFLDTKICRHMHYTFYILWTQFCGCYKY